MTIGEIIKELLKYNVYSNVLLYGDEDCEVTEVIYDKDEDTISIKFDYI